MKLKNQSNSRKSFGKAQALLLFLMFSFTLPVSAAFPDVPSSHDNQAAINYLLENSIIKGYEDGNFQPSKEINRAEFLKIALESARANKIVSPLDPENKIWPNSANIDQSKQCFSDVPVDAWFTKYICSAKAAGMIKGYKDGSFKPGQTISLVEAAKIILETRQQSIAEHPNDGIWYTPYIYTLSEFNFIPNSFKYFEQKLTRAQMAEITWRIMENKQSQPFIPASNLKHKPVCQSLGEDTPSNIDMTRVRQTWLSWLNEARKKQGLHAYRLNNQLNRTTTNWSKVSRDRGYMNHKRPGTTAYYDYNAITKWFRSLGLEFQNVNRATHTENIGWDVYSCSEADCTDYAISKARNSFNFFMREKGKAYAPHYNSIMNKYFNEIGFGAAVGGGKIYFTTHYGTKIISNPKEICD